MSWVMFIFVMGGGGLSLTSHDFTDKESCVSAAEHMVTRLRNYSSLVIQCHPKKMS